MVRVCRSVRGVGSDVLELMSCKRGSSRGCWSGDPQAGPFLFPGRWFLSVVGRREGGGCLPPLSRIWYLALEIGGGGGGGCADDVSRGMSAARILFFRGRRQRTLLLGKKHPRPHKHSARQNYTKPSIPLAVPRGDDSRVVYPCSLFRFLGVFFFSILFGAQFTHTHAHACVHLALLPASLSLSPWEKEDLWALTVVYVCLRRQSMMIALRQQVAEIGFRVAIVW